VLTSGYPKLARTLMTFQVSWETRTPKAPATDFWEQCKEQAFLSNVPAWLIAEEGFTHEEVDTMRRPR
jgi:hypothetical protein